MTSKKTGRLVIAGLRGGSGKTTIALGIVAAWRRKGRIIAPFKKGPDYIDAGWLAAAAGGPCYNLDLFMMGRDSILASYMRRSHGADAAIIEGNRGIYDGASPDGTYSTGELAKLLRSPVILVVEGTKATATLAAMVLGCQNFDPDVDIRGVIVNQVFGKRHEMVARKAIEQRCKIPVLGVIPRLSADRFPERHMGLTPSPEHPNVAQAIAGMADTAEAYLDLDSLWMIAREALALDASFPMETPAAHRGPSPKIGIIQDRAFQFYYPENLEALERHGATLVPISAMDDAALPPVDALYIGGGFPETQAEKLSANAAFRESLREACERGLPVYAECGGLMYLAEELVTGGKRFPMVGALPAAFGMEKRPQAHGYTTIRVVGENPYYEPGLVAKGHEFHYSRLLRLDRESTSLAFRMTLGQGLVDGRDGLCYRNILATYTHLHAIGTDAWAAGLVRKAEAFRNASPSGRPVDDEAKTVWVAPFAMAEDPAAVIRNAHAAMADGRPVYRCVVRSGPLAKGDLVYLQPGFLSPETHRASVRFPDDSRLLPLRAGRARMLWDASHFWGSMALGVLDELGFPVDVVSAAEIAEGALEGAGLLFVPGGWAHEKSRALGERGREAIRRFVREGGSYLGFCGGAGLALDVKDGLSLIPAARKETKDRNPNFSGRIRLKPLRNTHPLWMGLPRRPAFHAWWPSQFKIADRSKVRILAEYDAPEDDFFAADLKAGDVAEWTQWENRYGINLDPARLMGEPAVVEGRFGKGRVVLSYVHFETPGDPAGYRALFNLWQHLIATSGTDAQPVRGVTRPILSPASVKTLRAMSDEVFGLIELGRRAFLWNWRLPWMLNWKRGSKGFEFLTVYTLLRQLANLAPMFQGEGAKKFDPALEEAVKALKTAIRSFVLRSRRLIMEERYTSTSGKHAGRPVRALRLELFGDSHLYGGEFRNVLTRADAVLFPLIRSSRAS